MTPIEMKMNFPKEEVGLTFSPQYRLSIKESCEHCLTVAPNGRGKTSKKIFFDIVSWSGSIVCIDAIGENEKSLYKTTSGYLKTKGYNIIPIVLDDPQNSYHFNPLSILNSDDQLMELSEFLVEKVASQSDPVWHESASSIIDVFLTVLRQSKDRELLNLHNVAYLLRIMEVDTKEVSEFVYRTLQPESPNGDPETWEEYLNLLADNPNTRKGAIFTAKASLKLWRKASSSTSILTSDNTVDLKKLRQEKTIIYLIAPKHKIEKGYGTFLNLFLTACFEQASSDGRKKEMLPLAFLLDEFGNIGKIKGFGGYASTLREFGISLNIILQTTSQIYDLYGDKAGDNIIGNMHSKLYLSGIDDKRTCEELSRKLGKKTVQTVIEDQAEKKPKFVAKDQDLLTPDQIRMLGFDEALLICGNKKPVFFKKFYGYYRYKKYRKLASLSPYQAKPSFVKSSIKKPCLKIRF